MDSPLNYSRFSKNDSQIFRSTGTSLVFKTVGRNTKPNWSNRIIKDVNDLQYDLDINLLGKNRFHSATLEAKRSINFSNDKKSKITVRQKRKSFFSQQLDKIIKAGKFFASKSDRTAGQSEGKSGRKKRLSTIEAYGLSSFEYKNTIDGKMQTKTNLHLKFDKKAQRITDQKITWYNPEVEINIEKMDEKKYRRILQKYHPFQSYTDRKVFETKDKIDKVYETEESKRKTSPNRIKQTVPLITVPGRKEETVKQSAYLSYETRIGEYATMKSPPKYTIKNTQKQIKFSRQVINSKRGCYR